IRISNSPVIIIARPEKQSIPQHKERMDCFVAFAPRNDDRHTRPHSPGANAPELCKQFVAPKKTEGAGKAGCSMRPQPRTQRKKRTSVVATGSPKQSDLPCAMVYGLFRALPGDRAFLPPSPADRSANLTPASGRQDHTALPSAAGAFVSCAAASIASRLNVRDDRETPLLVRRDDGKCEADLGSSAMPKACDRLTRRAIFA